MEIWSRVEMLEDSTMIELTIPVSDQEHFIISRDVLISILMEAGYSPKDELAG